MSQNLRDSKIDLTKSRLKEAAYQSEELIDVRELKNAARQLIRLLEDK